MISRHPSRFEPAYAQDGTTMREAVGSLQNPTKRSLSVPMCPRADARYTQLYVLWFSGLVVDSRTRLDRYMSTYYVLWYTDTIYHLQIKP